MVNNINVPGGVNMKELSLVAQKRKTETAPEAILSLSEDELHPRKEYTSKATEAFKWCYRRNIGTYPKFWLSPIKKVSRFIVTTLFRHKIEIVARSRGPRPHGCRQDLPIKYAKRVAIYVSIYRR